MKRLVLYQGRIVAALRREVLRDAGFNHFRFTWPDFTSLSYRPPPPESVMDKAPYGSLDRIFRCDNLEVWGLTVYHGKVEDALGASDLFTDQEHTGRAKIGAAIALALTDHTVKGVLDPTAASYLEGYSRYLLEDRG